MCPTGPWIQLSERVSEPPQSVGTRQNAVQWKKKQRNRRSGGVEGGGWRVFGGEAEEEGTPPDCPLQTALKVAAESQHASVVFPRSAKRRAAAEMLGDPAQIHTQTQPLPPCSSNITTSGAERSLKLIYCDNSEILAKTFLFFKMI